MRGKRDGETGRRREERREGRSKWGWRMEGLKKENERQGEGRKRLRKEVMGSRGTGHERRGEGGEKKQRGEKEKRKWRGRGEIPGQK